jgi:O-antigen/teichoic acid export membrane protein
VGLGIYSFGAQSARLLSAPSDPFVLSLYFGPAILVFYSPVVTLLNAIKPFIYAVASQLGPLTTSFHVTNNREKVAQMLTIGTKYHLLQGAGAMAVVMGFSDSIMRVWLGNRLGTETALAASVLVALGFVDLMGYSGAVQYPVLLGLGRLKVFLVTAVPVSVAYILSSILLVGHTKLGIYGVLVPNLVLSLLTRSVISAHAAKLCGLRPRDYLAASYIRPFFVFALLLGFCLMVDNSFRPASYLALGCCATAALAPWVGLCWFVGFSSSERRRMTGVLYRGWCWLKSGMPGVASAPGGPTGGVV